MILNGKELEFYKWERGLEDSLVGGCVQLESS
jgi:hypothetical protein